MNYSNKIQLAVDAAVEFTKAWDSANNTKPINQEQFIDCIKEIYSTISELESE